MIDRELEALFLLISIFYRASQNRIWLSIHIITKFILTIGILYIQSYQFFLLLLLF